MGLGFFVKVNAVVAAAFLITDTSASWFSSEPKPDPNSDDLTDNWSDLRVTWSADLISKAFRKLPRNIFDTSDPPLTSPWNKSLNTDCTNGGRYAGYRLVKDDDPAMNIMVDKNGIIAGIQMNLLKKNLLVPQNKFRFSETPMFTENTINGEDYYTLTAYFVDPSRICSTPRTPQDLINEGTGTGLFFQNGPTPNDLIHAPRHKEAALKEGWTENNCFVQMGYHTFFEVEKFEENQCERNRPAFLLFDRKGEMHGFGFQVSGTDRHDRFENPPKLAIQMILGDTPDCLLDVVDTVGLTTMHVYFVERPALISCPVL